MADSGNLLRDPRFTMNINPRGCVDRIAPAGALAAGQVRPIGAIADDNVGKIDLPAEHFDPQARGDCVIVDRLTHQSHSFRHHAPFSRPWRAVQNWSAHEDYWEWTLQIDGLEGQERELWVTLSLPHPIYPGGMGSGHSKWDLWLPIAQQSLGADYGLRKVHFSQCLDEKTDVPLPLISLFDANASVNLGFSCLLPPDQTGYVDFEVDQRNWLTHITFKHLGLQNGKSINLRLWCFSHAGDWRPAMGWVRNRFPQLLGPVEGQEKLDGNMAYTIPINEKRIADWSDKMHLRWNELFYFRNFGDYFPDEPFNANHFQTPANPHWTADNLTYDDINRYIDTCHRHNVKVMPYFNISECESNIAHKRFPESVAKFYDNREMVCWVYYDGKNHNVVMNGDPQYPYFDFVVTQYEKLLKRCPGIDGLFFDQVCYGWIDTAHFDGVTFLNNKPAYNLGNMYLRAFAEIRRRLPRPRIVGLGNGIMRWQLMEYIDGAMSEGDPETLGRFSLISPERPLVCLAEGENAFQHALFHGSWMHVSPYYRYPTTEELPEDAVKLFAAYQPLLNLLEGRKMVYDPNPLKVEAHFDNAYKSSMLNLNESIRANIFRTAWGDYAVVVLALPKGMVLPSQFVPLTIDVKVPDAAKLNHAVILGVDYDGHVIQTPAMREDRSVRVKIPRHGAASMIILTDNPERLRSQGQWKALESKP
ncbi:MAG: hypothetical protein IT446_06290 [Phycisphaerales bacterium]|nr:hypothetical protein [Phycisphaerales bacterium]